MEYWYPLAKPNYGAEEIGAVMDCLRRKRTTMGEKVREFESAFSERFVDGRDSVMVNSGSSADLLIAMAAVNPAVRLLKPGDEILCPAVTWPTQIWSCVTAGLRVRLVDCDPSTLNMDLIDLERKITARTSAIFVVHLMGNPVDMHRVMELADEHDLVVFEDCCEILGSKFGGNAVGTFGDMSAFSFFHSHHISTMEGGMIACHGHELSDLVRQLRAHGWTRDVKYKTANPRFEFTNMGFNVRPTEISAAFGLAQLDKWYGFQWYRKMNSEKVRSALEHLGEWLQVPVAHPDAEPSWFGLPFIVTEMAPFTRDQLTRHLESAGIETRPIESGNMARHASMDLFPVECGPLPGADIVHDDGFYVGLHPEPGGTDELIGAIEEACRVLDRTKSLA